MAWCRLRMTSRDPGDSISATRKCCSIFVSGTGRELVALLGLHTWTMRRVDLEGMSWNVPERLRLHKVASYREPMKHDENEENLASQGGILAVPCRWMDRGIKASPSNVDGLGFLITRYQKLIWAISTKLSDLPILKF